MKNRLVVLVIMILAFVVTGCQPKEAMCNPNHEFKVGMITDVGGIDDRSFNQGTWEGIVRFGRAYQLCEGEGYRFIQSMSDAEYVPNLSALAEEGFDLIVAAGFLFNDALNEVAPKFPNQKFLVIDTVVDQPNVKSVLFAEHEGAYLVGVAAAHKAKADGKNTVGFIGGMESEVIHRFEAGFVAGVKSVDPNLTILIDYANSFDDDAKGQTLAAKQFDEGAYIIMHAAGQTGNGVIKEARDRRNYNDVRWVIGVDRDQYEDGIYDETNNRSVILTSMVKRVDIATETIARQTLEGFFTPGVSIFDLSNDGVGIPARNPNLSDEVIERVLEARLKIINGEIEVPSTVER